MRRSIDSAPRSRVRRERSVRSALRGPLFLLAVLISAAVAAATTSAQGSGEACDPAAPETAPNACPKQLSPPPGPPAEEEPPEEEPPVEQPPAEPPPAPKAPAPAPAPREVCPDGTWAPCPDPSTLVEDREETSEPERRRSCKKRPGVRRPKYCPRLRKKRAGGTSPQERARRRAARDAKERERCEKARTGQLGPVSSLGSCARQITVDDLLIAGRLPSRPLGEPLPPASRLDPAFARLLDRVAGDRWATVLALLRAEGKTGAAPAKAAEIGALAEKAAGGGGDERVKSAAAYYRAVGLSGLTRGMNAVKGELQSRVLGNGKISLYPGGRFDVSSGRVDVRVLVTMLYLAERHGSVSVTSLMSGHGFFTKSGHVSLHSYGRAMDIAAVGGTPIIGHQQPGGVTEAALRSVLMLPPELRPSELISLFEMGGPSFAMADHADHIHIGF